MKLRRKYNLPSTVGVTAPEPPKPSKMLTLSFLTDSNFAAKASNSSGSANILVSYEAIGSSEVGSSSAANILIVERAGTSVSTGGLGSVSITTDGTFDAGSASSSSSDLGVGALCLLDSSCGAILFLFAAGGSLVMLCVVSSGRVRTELNIGSSTFSASGSDVIAVSVAGVESRIISSLSKSGLVVGCVGLSNRLKISSLVFGGGGLGGFTAPNISKRSSGSAAVVVVAVGCVGGAGR
ncbi:hypothetical protein GQX74_007448 [Glossina fuscipes]|nr:hypothetical protein GQX74_007448 [Glossina fuscipes]